MGSLTMITMSVGALQPTRPLGPGRSSILAAIAHQICALLPRYHLQRSAGAVPTVFSIAFNSTVGYTCPSTSTATPINMVKLITRIHYDVYYNITLTQWNTRDHFILLFKSNRDLYPDVFKFDMIRVMFCMLNDKAWEGIFCNIS